MVKKAGAKRLEPRDSLDYFPTPPWATRALFEHVLFRQYGEVKLSDMSVLEPACGAGHMSEILKQYFSVVVSADIEDYGYPCLKMDYLKSNIGEHNWVITNPPFTKAAEFIERALVTTNVGVAMLTRLAFLEGKGRYESLYSKTPPTKVAVFTERVPFQKGKLDKNASSAMATCWLVWEHEHQSNTTELLWIPPCRAVLERDDDYT